MSKEMLECFDPETKNERQLFEQDMQESSYNEQSIMNFKSVKANDICTRCKEPYSKWFYCCNVNVIKND